MFLYSLKPSTYDHKVWKTGLPARSDVLKPHAVPLAALLLSRNALNTTILHLNLLSPLSDIPYIDWNPVHIITFAIFIVLSVIAAICKRYAGFLVVRFL
ncbi:hypothetical protein N7445_004148 [Penicillium cf. griseofulvum]|nr:hypothetical protein N7445_004148 [Penicillium cf. griseofulvum]